MALYNFSREQQFSNLNQSTDFRPDQYKYDSPLSVYNHNNPDIATAEKMVLENLRISGAWVTVLPRSEDNKFDKTWNEDSSPTYYTGYDFKAFFVPPPPEITLTKFGIDAPAKFDVTFSRAELLDVMGDRLIRPGDIIIIPHNSLAIKATRFRIVHAADSGNYRYRWLYYIASVENLSKDETLSPKII